jgi:hypothetical protein
VFELKYIIIPKGKENLFCAYLEIRISACLYKLSKFALFCPIVPAE